MPAPDKVTIKVVMVGDQRVGKSSIIKRYEKDNYSDDYVATIGTDFRTKNLTPDGNRKIQIWDTSSNPNFHMLQHPQYSGVDVFIIVFDLTKYQSFVDVEDWIGDIKEHAQKDYQIVLVGNKADLVADCLVTSEEIDEFVQKHPEILTYIPVSAKTGENVEHLFKTITTAKEVRSTYTPPQEEARPSPSPSFYLSVLGNNTNVMLKRIAVLLIIGGIISGGVGMAVGITALTIGGAVSTGLGAGMLLFFGNKRNKPLQEEFRERATRNQRELRAQDKELYLAGRLSEVTL